MEHVAKLPLDYLLAALAVIFALGLIAFIIAMGWLAGALKNIKSLFEKQAESHQVGPQPFEVKAAAQFTQHADFMRLEGDFKALRDERKKDVGELHTRIDKLDREMGGVLTAQQLTNTHLERIEQKLDRR